MQRQSIPIESTDLEPNDLVRPKVSVIVPIYNVEAYLAQCLDSVLAQSFSDFELICVNDGSTDSSAQILAEYVSKDFRIRPISQENQGQSKARNVGMDHARGEYILFLDSDDAIAPYALDFFLRIASETQGKVVVCDRMISGDTQFKPNPVLSYRSYTRGLTDLVALRRSYSTACNKLYHADSLKDLRFIVGIAFEDWPFLTLYFNEVKDFAVTSIPLYYYNKSGVSTVRSPFSEHKIRSYFIGMKAVAEFYRGKTDFLAAKKRIHIALKMCINATYRDKANRACLAPFLVAQLQELRKEGLLDYWRLPPKTLWRLYCLKKK